MKSVILLVCLAVAIRGQQQDDDDLFARLFRSQQSNVYQGGDRNPDNFERLNFESDGSVRFPASFGQPAESQEQKYSPNVQYAANEEGEQDQRFAPDQRFLQRFSQPLQQQDTHNFAPSTNFNQLRSFQFPNY